MPIQELLVANADELTRPCGVLFDPPCKTREQDLKLWGELIVPMAGELAKKRYIMVLVQTRNSRSWNDQAKQYDFKPAEDYIIASYSVAADVGNPYEPGTVALRWLTYKDKEQQGRTMRLDADMIHMFQCSDQGCNLSTVGMMKLTKFHMTNGKSQAEALNIAKNSIGDGQKFGWRGGVFPKQRSWQSSSSSTSSGRSRSNAVFGSRPGI